MNLHECSRIILIRVNNGWVVKDEYSNTNVSPKESFAFESTQSLQKQLVTLLGNSGCKVQQVMPERDEKGHFIPKP